MIRADLEGKSLPELRQMCTIRNILGVSGADQNTLISAILDYEGIDANPTSIGGAAAPTGGGMVQVSSGASSSRFPVGGKTLGEVRAQLREALNIDSMSQGVVNGSVEDSNYIVQPSDVVEFIKQAGKKG